MGVADLRESFTAALTGGACQRAFLSYERVDGQEWQLIEFRGIRADGTPFSIKSDRLPAGANLIEAARALAQKLEAQP